MRALIVNTQRRVSPFGEAPGEALFGTSTVGAHMRALLEKRGLQLTVVDDEVPALEGPVVVLADHTVVSEKVLGDFLGRAFDLVTTEKKAARLSLAQTPAVDFTLPLSSAAVEEFDAEGVGARPPASKSTFAKREGAAAKRVSYDCFFVPSVDRTTSRELLERLRRESVRVVVPKRELAIPFTLPTLGDGDTRTLLLPVSSWLAAHVEHWTHILWVNQAFYGTQWLTIAREHKGWCAWRLLLTALRPPWSFASLSRQFVRVGKNVRIHPTAWVEASIIGDNVTIGARASVRNSVLGDGVVVGDHATVLSTTLAARVAVTPRTFVVWSAAYEDAVLSNYKLQVSLIGKGSSVSTWAGFVDAKLQGAIDVQHDGKLQSTQRSFLGSCVGHGAHVGAKVLILPGREVPNGAAIVMRDDEVITSASRELPPGVPLVRDQGSLSPLRSPDKGAPAS